MKFGAQLSIIHDRLKIEKAFNINQQRWDLIREEWNKFNEQTKGEKVPATKILDHFGQIDLSLQEWTMITFMAGCAMGFMPEPEYIQDKFQKGTNGGTFGDLFHLNEEDVILLFFRIKEAMELTEQDFVKSLNYLIEQGLTINEFGAVCFLSGKSILKTGP